MFLRSTITIHGEKGACQTVGQTQAIFFEKIDADVVKTLQNLTYELVERYLRKHKAHDKLAHWDNETKTHKVK
jgi:hypothetical protein